MRLSPYSAEQGVSTKAAHLERDEERGGVNGEDIFVFKPVANKEGVRK